MPTYNPRQSFEAIARICRQRANPTTPLGQLCEDLAKHFEALAPAFNATFDPKGESTPTPKSALEQQAAELLDDIEDEFENADEIIPVEQYRNKA